MSVLIKKGQMATLVQDGKRYAVIPYEDFERLLEAAEVNEDIALYRSAIAKNEERVPAELVDRILAGESPVRAWREHRGLTLDELANKSGVSKPYLSQIENRERAGKRVLDHIADALNVTVDELIDVQSAPRRSVRAKATRSVTRGGTRTSTGKFAARSKRQRQTAKIGRAVAKRK